MDKKEVAAFVAILLHSGTVAHFQHLSTDSYSKHKALRHYYEDIIGLVDDLCELYMGRYEQIKIFPHEFSYVEEPLEYFEMLQASVDENREDLPQDTDIQNVVDEISQLINSTIYKLKFLK